jgi:8-oxo-dGTP pyrophosphatase MutT (NUDIX family)
MHYIQLEILRRLLHADRLGYAALRPKGVESNHYAYHLERLIADKMVEKEGKFYRLTPKGVDYVDRLSSEKMVYRPQPFIDTAIDLTTADGRTLLFQRNFQPYFHLIGFPAGKLHMTESIAEAAARELSEKTGITGVPLAHRGVTYVEAHQNGVVISKKLYHVFHGDALEGFSPITPEQRGTCFWADHSALDPNTLMPGFLKIKNLLAASNEFFFTEITEDLNV